MSFDESSELGKGSLSVLELHLRWTRTISQEIFLKKKKNHQPYFKFWAYLPSRPDYYFMVACSENFICGSPEAITTSKAAINTVTVTVNGTVMG